MQNLSTVLYVDDEPDIRSIVQMALELTPGVKVHTAGSGEEAIEEARRLRPDLVLLDVMMPGLDGPGTFARMRAHAELSGVPVIFMTAKALPDEVERFLRMGAIGVIAKPFDPMQLGAQVDRLWNASGRAAPLPQSDRPASVDQNTSLHAAPESPTPRQVQERSTALAAKFLRRTAGELETLRELVSRWGSGAGGALAEIEHLTHRLHGTGATLGLDGVSECAGALERAVREIDANDGQTPRSVRDLLDCVARLAREVESAALRSGVELPHPGASGE